MQVFHAGLAVVFLVGLGLDFDVFYIALVVGEVLRPPALKGQFLGAPLRSLPSDCDWCRRIPRTPSFSFFERCDRTLAVLVRYIVWLIWGYSGFVLVCSVWGVFVLYSEIREVRI